MRGSLKNQFVNAVASMIGIFVVVAALGSAARAQSVSPMRQEVSAVSDRATAQFTVANPYDTAQTSDFYVVDGRTGAPIRRATVFPRRQQLGPRARARLTVSVPMNGQRERTAYVCHSITPRYGVEQGGGTSFRGEVCAKLVVERFR